MTWSGRIRLGNPRQRVVVARSAAAVLTLTTAVSGCGRSTAANAPVLTIVTGLYPLAQAATQIGQSKVRVIDVVPVGVDPRTYRLAPSQVALVRTAGLVLVEGGGFQPSLEQAARGTTGPTWSVQQALTAPEGYAWLDPAAMERIVTSIGAAMKNANPAAGGLYRDGTEAYTAAIHSTGIDFESTLSTCRRLTIFTADQAFEAASKTFGLEDRAVGTGEPATDATVSQIRATGATTVFSESYQSPAEARAVMAVAAATGAKIRNLDTLTGAPPGGWPHQATYLNLMEANLGALVRALGCADSGSGT